MDVLIVSESFIIRDALSEFFSKEFENTTVRVLNNLSKLNDINMLKIDFMFIDIGHSNIIDRISILKERFNNLKILAFGRSNDNEAFLNLYKSNVHGYILDILEKEELKYIVKKILRGKKYYDMDLLEKIICDQPFKDYENLNTLTPREVEVLNEVSQGFSNKDIAEKLYITEHTIKKHITNILSKLDMKNRKDLIIYAKDMRI